jgi:hypothetical protein
MRSLALIFGIVFLIVGIGGFIPQAFTNDQLFKVFKVNILLNLLHLLSGIIAIIIAWTNRSLCRLYFQICGVVYATMALLGLIYAENEILGVFSNNRPDTWFHMIIAIAALVIGYGGAEVT